MPPPAVAPTAAPLSAAMIGPAAMNGPTPGMASAPMPASRPSTPPVTPPVAAPVVAPSGALVAFTCPMSCLPSVSGSNTEISELANPADCRRSTIPSACEYELAIQKTDFFDIILVWLVVGWLKLFRRFNFELVLDLCFSGVLLRELPDLGFLRGVV